MNVKRNLSMILTAIAAFLVLLSNVSASGGSSACVVRGTDRLPTLVIQLGLPDYRQ